LVSLNFYGQNNNALHEFQFYHNGYIENKKAIQIALIIGLDTIDCGISEGQIVLPKSNLKGSILMRFKKKSYQIDDVDFSKIDVGSLMIFGVEKNMKNFALVTEEFPNLYHVKNTLSLLEIENIEQVKEICFVSFPSKLQNGKNMTVKNYNKTSITNK